MALGGQSSGGQASFSSLPVRRPQAFKHLWPKRHAKQKKLRYQRRGGK